MYAKITNSTIVNSIVDILIFNMGGGKSVKTQGRRNANAIRTKEDAVILREARFFGRVTPPCNE